MEFDIKNCDLNKNMVIEASAGTGKTHNIIGIVKNLVESKVPPTSILVVTYTEKAAEELRKRLRGSIKDKVDEMTIGTIHSFCKSVIEQFPLLTKANTGLSIVNDVETFVYRFLRQNDFIKKFGAYVQYNMDSISECLIQLYKRYYLNEQNEENKEIISLKDERLVKEFKILMACKNFDELVKTREFSCLTELQSIDSSLYDELKANFNKYRILVKVCPKDNRWKKSTAKAKLDEQNPAACIAMLALKDFYIEYQEYKKNLICEDFDDLIKTVYECLTKNSNLKEKLQSIYHYGIIDEFQDTSMLEYSVFKAIFLDCNDNDHHLIVVGDPKQSIYAFKGSDINVYYRATDEIVNQKGGDKYNLSVSYRSSPEIVDFFNKFFVNDVYFGNNTYVKCSATNNNGGFKAKFKGNDVTKPLFVNANYGISKEDYALLCVEKIIDFCSYNDQGHTNLQIKSKDDNEFRNVTLNDFAVLGRAKADMYEIERLFERIGIPYSRYKDNSLFTSKEFFSFKILLQAITIKELTEKNIKYFRQALLTDFFKYSLQDVSKDVFCKCGNDEFTLISKWNNLLVNKDYLKLIDSIINDSYLLSNLSSVDKQKSLGKYYQISDIILNMFLSFDSIDAVLREMDKMIDNNKSSDEDENDDSNSNIVERSSDRPCIKTMTMHASKGLQFPVVICVSKPISTNARTKAFVDYDKNNHKTLGITGTFHSLFEEQKRLFYVGFTRAQYILFANYGLMNISDFNKKSFDSYLTNYPNEFNFIDDYVGTTSQDIFNLSLGNHKGAIDKYNLKKPLINDLKKLFEDNVLKYLNINANNISQLKKYQIAVIKDLNDDMSSKTYHKHSYVSLTHPDKPVVLLDDDESIDKEREVEELVSNFDKNGIQSDVIYSCQTPVIDYSALPKGTSIGCALHEIFEKLDFTYDYSSGKYDGYLELLFKECYEKQKLFYDTNDDSIFKALKSIVVNTLKANIPLNNGKTFTLSDIGQDQKRCEIEFNYNIKNDLMKDFANGFIDLVVYKDGKYIVFDYKSDSLRDDFTSYSDKDSLKYQVDSHYAIQRVLYAYTLINFLHDTSYPDEDLEDIFTNHFGGACYLFIKGTNEGTSNGVYMHTWKNYKELKESFDEIMNARGI